MVPTALSITAPPSIILINTINIPFVISRCPLSYTQVGTVFMFHFWECLTFLGQNNKGKPGNTTPFAGLYSCKTTSSLSLPLPI